MRYKLMTIIALMVSVTTRAADTSSLSSRVDEIFKDYGSGDVPGCAVGIIHGGAYVHAKGYGSANLEHRIPIGMDSVFRIGSVSKQFTAAAIAILAARGDIDLDADVHKYLPDLREYDHPVIEWNRNSFRQMECVKEIAMIPGATHLFEEKGTLEQVADQAASWFNLHFTKHIRS